MNCVGKAMLKKATFIVMVMVMTLLANCAQADEIINGSFEDDGLIYDIMVEEPSNWDVNAPAEQFGGWVYTDWVTDGYYNLTLYSKAYKTFEVNDIATVSQKVCLYDVNEIVFDIKLDTQSASNPWDPLKRTAVLMIDDDVVWESNDIGPDVRGEYFDQFYTVEEKYKDTNSHMLSLALRVDVNEATTNIKYYIDWDFIRFNLHCGDNGFLAGDFNRDCAVDMNDLGMLAEKWLNEIVPNDKYNLSKRDDLEAYGVINLFDFAVFADSWDCNMADLKAFTDVWLNEVCPNHQYNLFRDDDVDSCGIINFFDFSVFADNWLSSSF